MGLFENYNWETEFVTKDNQMIHTFSDRVKVVTSLKEGTVKVLKDGNVIRSLEGMYISDYEKLLLEVAKDTKTLSSFSHDAGTVSD